MYERCPYGLETLAVLVDRLGGGGSSGKQGREREQSRAGGRRPGRIGVLEEAFLLLVCSAGRLSGQAGGLSPRGRPAVPGAQGPHLVDGSNQRCPARLLALLKSVEAAFEVGEGLVGGSSGLFGLLDLQTMAEDAREVEAVTLAVAGAMLVYLRTGGLGIGVEGGRLGVYEQRRVFSQPQTGSRGSGRGLVVEDL